MENNLISVKLPGVKLDFFPQEIFLKIVCNIMANTVRLYLESARVFIGNEITTCSIAQCFISLCKYNMRDYLLKSKSYKKLFHFRYYVYKF